MLPRRGVVLHAVQHPERRVDEAGRLLQRQAARLARHLWVKVRREDSELPRGGLEDERRFRLEAHGAVERIEADRDVVHFAFEARPEVGVPLEKFQI